MTQWRHKYLFVTNHGTEDNNTGETVSPVLPFSISLLLSLSEFNN